MNHRRLDLGPNRWMAVAGQAFLYVYVKRGWSVNIVVAPVSDVDLDSGPFRGPGDVLITAFAFLVVLPQIVWNVIQGRYDSSWALLALVGIASSYMLWALLLIRGSLRRVLLYGYHVNQIPFSNAEWKSPDFLQFIVHMHELSKTASMKPGKGRAYTLDSWRVPSLTGVIFVGLISAVVPWVWEGGSLRYVFMTSMILVFGIFAVASRHLILHRDLRGAHARLLDSDPDVAIEILHAFLSHRPKHAYAKTLLTIAELLRGNMDAANEIVVQQDKRVQAQLGWSPKLLVQRLWQGNHVNR